MSVNDHVRTRIRELRTAKRLRVSEVARRAEIALGSYSCLEAGHYKISLENLYRILFALGVGVMDVWPDDRAPDPMNGGSSECAQAAGPAGPPDALLKAAALNKLLLGERGAGRQ